MLHQFTQQLTISLKSVSTYWWHNKKFISHWGNLNIQHDLNLMTILTDKPCWQDWWVCVQSQYEASDALQIVQGISPFGHPSSGRESGPFGGLPWLCPGNAPTAGLPWPCLETPLSDSPAFCRETSLSPVDGWETCPFETLCEPLGSGEACPDLHELGDWLRAF